MELSRATIYFVRRGQTFNSAYTVAESRILHVSFPEEFGADYHWRELRNAVRHVPNQSPILDIGCGSGLISRLIQTNLSYVGIDFNPNYLSRDWKGCAVDGKLVGSILRLPLMPESVKSVLLLHVIEHFPQQLQMPLLKEAYQVLAQGGTMIISTPNLGTLRNSDKFLPPNNPKHFHCLRREELRDLLRQVGFRKIRRHGYDVFVEYPSPLARLIPHVLRRAIATAFPTLEKCPIFTALKE